ncbi:hypothetical protein BCR42DRAFT_447572 [Absidia repens]|uniref:Uncharacterized protein n=1 Tax=Absidia repens TaxID=90262 RepID=A0A1X2ITZ2_9FUNG|nr:hypothetical protein BCR42DRAFT_447572 [Absidia repens]
MKEKRKDHFLQGEHDEVDTIGPLEALSSEEELETENVTQSRILTTTMTSHSLTPYTHPRSIPANIILPPLTSYQTLFDPQPTPNAESSSFHSTLFFQNWLQPGSSTTSNTTTTGQFFSEQQQAAFLTPQTFYYGSLGSSSYISPSYTSSYFDPNHVDVIMDDGSRQKRTVSLSTMPRFPSLTSILSTRGGADETTHLLTWTSSPHDSSSLSPQQQKRNQSKTQPALPTAKHLTDQQDYFSDSDNSEDELYGAKKKKKKASTMTNILSWLRPPALSTGQKLVLKCSFAYIIGASFTFVPALHKWMNGGVYGYDDSVTRNRVATDMAATVAVFFNPAKTVGGMIEAAGFGWIMTLGALAICLASLWSTDYFLDHLRQTRPSVGTASSLAFIILFPILLREHTLDESQYSRQKIQDTVSIVAIGTAISAAVCFFVWPQTATKKFNFNMNDSLQSLRVLLKLLTKTFLLDADLPDFKANESLAQAIRAHEASFTALQSSLQEARLEWWWWSPLNDNKREGNDDGYERIVKSIQQLALHIGGLRKSCGLQFDRTQHTMSTSTTGTRDGDEVYQVKADDHRRKFERVLKKEHSTQDTTITTVQHISTNDIEPIHDEEHNSNSDNADLVSFIRAVGPTMKSLAFTCKQTIIHLQWHFTPESTKTSTSLSPPPSFATLRRNLGLALELFEQSQQKALERMCRRYTKTSNSKKRPLGTQTTNNPSPFDVHASALAHLPADDVFLVYFFVYCLIAFAKELEVLVTCMEHVFDQTECATSWTYLVSGTIGLFTFTFQSNRNPVYSPNNHHTLDTLHTPTPNDRIHSFRMNLWRFFSWFRQYQVRYAIKAGLTALILSSLAFIPSTQYYFQTYRMEWTLITALAVMTPTVGGTNYIAALQLGATVSGVVIGAVIYRLFSESHVIWSIGLTWLLSLPCFWMVLHKPKYGKFGQFTLLAYTLVILYKYNHPDVDVYDLAYQRCLSVGGGVIIGLVVTTYISPYEARKAMRYGLSDLLLKYSREYYALNGKNNNSSSNNNNDNTIAMMSVNIGTQSSLGDDNATLLELQQDLCNLSTLLNHTPNEPRLKGRFPVETYKVMLRSCQSILDNLVMMRMVMAARENDHRMNDDKNWSDMVGNVVLYFYVLASALQLKTPLPPYLPPADMARKQLMGRSQATTTTKGTIPTPLHDGSSSSYMAYYAYIVLMETMLYDMDQLGYHMKALYGSLIPHWHY